MDVVLAAVEKETGESQVLLSIGTTRQVVMAALYNFAGLNNREIGDIMGVDYSTVSQGRKRLRERAGKAQSISLLLEHYEFNILGRCIISQIVGMIAKRRYSEQI